MGYAQARRNGLWFGTELHMDWFPTPNRGADVSPEGWNSGGNFLDGGGWEFNTFGSHKQYVYEWPSTSSREVAQRMKSYADGSYGRGLLYFQDCTMFDTNVLPARVADPSMAVGYEGSTLVYGAMPTSAPAAFDPVWQLPMYSTTYDVSSVRAGFRKGGGGVFIPIPRDHTLYLGAVHYTTGSGGIYVTAQDSLGNLGVTSKLTELPVSTAEICPDEFSGVAGVWLWFGRQAEAAGTIVSRGLVARIGKTGDIVSRNLLQTKPWMGGQGHSGCRFMGKPTYVQETGVNGGQVSFAATFRETGSWSLG